MAPRTKKPAPPAPDKPSEDAPVTLKRQNMVTAAINIRGVTPLIVRRFDEKAKEMIAVEQSRAAGSMKAKKEPRDPEKDFMSAQYRLPDGRHGVSSLSFRGAILSAVRFFEGITIVETKTLFRVIGEGPEQLVPLDIEAEPVMRCDAVRLSRTTTSLAYRPEYWPWATTLKVRFNADRMPLDSVVNLIHASGECGICEWRPSAPVGIGGPYGCYEVVDI